MSERYTTVLDPCGVHFIWDEHAMEPVISRDQILAFPDVQKAAEITEILNASANDNQRVDFESADDVAWGWLK